MRITLIGCGTRVAPLALVQDQMWTTPLEHHRVLFNYLSLLILFCSHSLEMCNEESQIYFYLFLFLFVNKVNTK